MATVYAYLPAVARALAPELDGDWPGEAAADCDHCSLLAPDLPHPWGFAPGLRCCTAHPVIANFLVGRALARGDLGSDRVRARLADRGGVSARGIDPPPGWAARYQRTKADGFGRDPSLACPFVDGAEPVGCGVWRDRPAMCRSWYCRHGEGLTGAHAWASADHLATELELGLARLLIARGAPPALGADIDAWVAWFAWCAGEVDRLTEAEVAPLAAGLARHRTGLIPLRRSPAIPPVLVAAVSELVAIGDDVLVTGYSTFDAVRAPRAIFALLARLDGALPWRDALAATRAQLGEPAWLDEALVRELVRVGALRAPSA
ncbi:MAG: hypothetical protein K8W52_14495 [Deltaproteobacteria bacterium]|nr:hypothetical protein [Deltaproteobacteria bacterium]